MTDIKTKLSLLREQFESCFELSLSSMHESDALWNSASYYLRAPGKRIRPVLVLLIGEMLQVKKEKLFGFATALEFLHNSSLIHDDLPALDNDDFRRGKPTCHKVFGEANALLAGDALIVDALRVILDDANISPDKKVSLCSLLVKSFYNLCVGQVLDIADTKPDFVVENKANHLEQKHKHKTGALFRACCLGPAVVSGYADNSNEYKALSHFGFNFGLLFQITDDILDAQELPFESISQDERQNSLTFVSLYDLEGAKAKAKEIAEQSKSLLDGFGTRADDLKSLVDLILTRDH